MKLPRVLAVLAGIALLVAALGCSTTPNIEATVEARAKELVAAQPTPTTILVVKGVTIRDTDTAAPTDTLVPMVDTCLLYTSDAADE